MSETQLSDAIQPFFEEIFKKTINNEEIKNEVEFIYGFWEEWSGNFLHPFGDNLVDAGTFIYENSLIPRHFAAQSLNFEWLSYTLMCGNYSIVMRELRTILEILFPIYYIDMNFPDLNLDEKLKKLEEIEESRIGYGKSVFEMSGYENWESYYNLFRRLCAYTHISTKVTTRDIKRWGEGFHECGYIAFDKNAFLDVYYIWRKVAYLAIDMVEKYMKKMGIPMRDYYTIKRLFDD